MRPLALWLAFGCALAASPARADIVESPPERCPLGSAGQMSHAGPHCEPTACAGASECPAQFWRGRPRADFSCEPLGLCVARRALHLGRAGERELSFAVRSCSVDADCPSGVPCEVRHRCALRGEPPLEGDASLPYGVVLALLLFFAAGAAWSVLRAGHATPLAEALAERTPAPAHVRVEVGEEAEAELEASHTERVRDREV